MQAAARVLSLRQGRLRCRQQAVVLAPRHTVALARLRFNACPVKDQDPASSVAHQAGALRRAQHQQVDAGVMGAVLLGDPGNVGIETEDLAEFPSPGAGALLDELALLGDGVDLGAKLGRQTQGGGQVGIRIGVNGQHAASVGGVKTNLIAINGDEAGDELGEVADGAEPPAGEGAGERGLAHAALTGNREFESHRDFHFRTQVGGPRCMAVWLMRMAGCTIEAMAQVKTTLKINDTVMALLRREAVRRGCTMSELVENALRLLLERRPKKRTPAPLPVFSMGAELVDVSDRDALYDAMEDR